MKIQVQVSDLGQLKEAIHKASLYFMHEDSKSAARNLGDPKTCPLAVILDEAYEKADAMIRGE